MLDRSSPPPITPRQMDILRAVTAMAWADGTLEPDEIHVMLDRLALLFGKTEAQQRELRHTLREYLGQNIPLEEVIPHLQTSDDRKLVLKLAYQVIQASRRHPDEPLINLEEAAAYQRLVRLLDLPPADVREIEAASSLAGEEPLYRKGFVDNLVERLHRILST